MENQNLKNHARIHPLYHFVLLIFVLGSLGTAVTYFIDALIEWRNINLAVVLLLMAGSLVALFMLVRLYPLKAQDRAIRAEENLRHYVLTGKLLDKRLSARQIVALRFASDEEFPALSEKAAENNWNTKEIKEKIQDWRGDYYRI
ncbi:hypothetical protein SAMN04488137_3963 [Fictibacillus solisalsi]|uniref:Uncharacterized protein n=1 Tax=Fictibacillus solisalsi TaxID=459525 RepID=A0A1H0A863_9BACL|nr:DUF6526 family protein [Fictibacillus solisalsi]SDN29421.1 hypothetical protein SAMN04488137_3963 [Fictibacillus solisalsi]